MSQSELSPAAGPAPAASFLIAANVEVKRTVKGELPAMVRFKTSDGCCYCAFSFEIARTYLLFANRNGEHFATSTCTRSKLVESAGEELRELGIDWRSK